MTKQIQFVSVDEAALETVSGGLLNILNGSVNCNDIKVLSDLSATTSVGDVLSVIGNIGNEVH